MWQKGQETEEAGKKKAEENRERERKKNGKLFVTEVETETKMRITSLFT